MTRPRLRFSSQFRHATLSFAGTALVKILEDDQSSLARIKGTRTAKTEYLSWNADGSLETVDQAEQVLLGFSLMVRRLRPVSVDKVNLALPLSVLWTPDGLLFSAGRSNFFL